MLCLVGAGLLGGPGLLGAGGLVAVGGLGVGALTLMGQCRGMYNQECYKYITLKVKEPSLVIISRAFCPRKQEQE